MRGGARISAKSFKVPPSRAGGKSYDPFELPDIFDELPVAPTTTPITDNFGVRWASETDPRDCAAYPSSPWCGGNPIRLGPPIGYDFEIKSNDCEICVYLYPVIAWLKLTPTVFCYRDPNCGKTIPPPDLIEKDKPPKYNENVQPDRYKSPECANRESIINKYLNWLNSFSPGEGSINEYGDEVRPTGTETTEKITKRIVAGYNQPYQIGDGNSIQRASPIEGDVFVSWNLIARYDVYLNNQYIKTGASSYPRQTWIPAQCPNMPSPPTIKPPPFPPPYGDEKDDGDKDKKGRKPVCCNECKDSADRIEKTLKDIKKILGTGTIKVPKSMDSTLSSAEGTAPDITKAIEYFGKLFATRLGSGRYPIEVPESLLTGVGDKTQNVESVTDYMYWLTHQIDSLVGEFPIKIEVEDIDPLTPGKQPKTLIIDNIAEAIAETYVLSLKSAINQEVELNVLFRLAGELLAVKNSSAITQDYVKANATFLGYKGNQKARELNYNFDFRPQNADKNSPNAETIPAAASLELMLKNTTGYVQGWEINDKETVVGFLQKLMFSAGIIKSVFFRGKKQLKNFNNEITRMATDAKEVEANWEKFVRDIENPNSDLNQDYGDSPEIKEIRKQPPSPKK